MSALEREESLKVMTVPTRHQGIKVSLSSNEHNENAVTLGLL